MQRPHLVRVGALGVFLLSAVFPLPADTIYWNGGSGGWDTLANWTTDPTATTPNPLAVPGSSDDVWFNRNSTNGAGSISLNADQSALSLTFRQTGTTTLIGGGTNRILNLGTGGITTLSGAGASTIGSSTAGQNVGVNLTGNQIWDLASGTSLTIFNGITGSSTLTKNGPGSLSVRSASAGFSGAVTINAGTVNNGGSAVSSGLGTGQLTINGGTISNSSNGGTVGFSLANTSQIWGGDFTLSAGTGGTSTLTLGAATANTITLSGSRQVFVEGQGTSNNSTININGTIGDGGNGYGITWGGSLSGTRDGNVRVNLSTAASTYSGVTVIKGGLIQFQASVGSGAASAFGNATSAIQLGNTSGTAQAGILAFGSNLTFARDIELQSGGTGTLIIGGMRSSGSGSGSMSNSGTITLGTGTTGRGVILHNGNFSGDIEDPEGLLSSAGLVTIQALRASNANAENSTSVTLSGNNTFSGGVQLKNDSTAESAANQTVTLNVNSANALGTGTLSIGTATSSLIDRFVALDNTTASAITLVNNNEQVWNWDFRFGGTRTLDMGTGAVSLGTNAGTTRTITTNVVNGGSALGIGGVISNGTTANALTKAGVGTLILYGNSTYTGTTTISAGTLQIGNGGSSGSLATSNIVNNGTLVFNRSDADLELDVVISGSGGVTQAGSGSTKLGGANTYTGATIIDDGTLIVDGSLDAASAVSLNGGTLSGLGTVAGLVTTQSTASTISPGSSPGTLTLSGGLNAANGATFNFELGTSSDLLMLGAFTGSTSPGALVFNFSDAGGLLAGNPYTLIDFASATDLDYTDFTSNFLPAGYMLDTSYGTGGFLIDEGSTSLLVQFAQVPEPRAGVCVLLTLVGFSLVRRRRIF